MKNLMKKITKSKAAKFLKNQRGQGMLEYILLVVVVVGLVMVAKPFLNQQLEGIKTQLGSAISNVTGGGN